MPLDTIKAPRRHNGPSATQVGDDSESSSSSGSSSSSSGKSLPSQSFFFSQSSKQSNKTWGNYKYRRSRVFSKLDEEVLADLEAEEMSKSPNAQGSAVHHTTVIEYQKESSIIRGSIHERARMAVKRLPAKSPKVGANRSSYPLWTNSEAAYAAFKQAGHLGRDAAGPLAEFTKEPPAFDPSSADALALTNHGRSPEAPLKFFFAGLCYPIVSAIRYCFRMHSVDSSPYAEYPLSQNDVAIWMGADADLSTIAKSMQAKFRPTGAELRAVHGDNKMLAVLNESKVEVRQGRLLCERVRAMLEDEAELLSPFVSGVCEVASSRVAEYVTMVDGVMSADQSTLVAQIVQEFDSFLASFERMLYRRYYQSCSAYGCTQAQCRNIVWLTGGSSKSMRILLPMAKMYVYEAVCSLDETGRRKLARQGNRGKLCRIFKDIVPFPDL